MAVLKQAYALQRAPSVRCTRRLMTNRNRMLPSDNLLEISSMVLHSIVAHLELASGAGCMAIGLGTALHNQYLRVPLSRALLRAPMWVLQDRPSTSIFNPSPTTNDTANRPRARFSMVGAQTPYTAASSKRVYGTPEMQPVMAQPCSSNFGYRS